MPDKNLCLCGGLCIGFQHTAIRYGVCPGLNCSSAATWALQCSVGDHDPDKFRTSTFLRHTACLQCLNNKGWTARKRGFGEKFPPWALHLLHDWGGMSAISVFFHRFRKSQSSKMTVKLVKCREIKAGRGPIDLMTYGRHFIGVGIKCCPVVDLHALITPSPFKIIEYAG